MEWEDDDMQLEDEGSDDGNNTTDTELADSGDVDGADETQVVAQDTEIAPDEEDARMMEDPADSREAQAVEACDSVKSDDGGPKGDEPTQATQATLIDSPEAPTQEDEDTQSLNPMSVGQAAADGIGARRTPSPLRRNGLGSNVSLSRGGAAGAAGAAGAGAGDGGASSGFLSSAEPSAKAAKGPSASSLSPHPLPQGWLDEQPKAARAAATGGARAQARPKKRVQHASGGSASTTATEEAAAVPQALRKKPSPAKAVADPAAWIRTKGSPSKGKGRKAAAADAAGEDDDEHATALDTQEGSISQSILAIGVPHERRVLEPPRPRPAAAVGAAATAANTDQEGGGGDDDGEEEEILAAGATGGTAVNSQEIRADEFSQIRKGCSQEKDELNRMMDDAMAGAAVGGGAAHPLPGAPEEGSPQQAEPGSEGVSGGDGNGKDVDRGGGKRKKMKASAQVAAGGSGVNTPRGGVAGHKRAAGSRTPGAYVGGQGAKSSTKKRAVPSRPDSANQRTPTVFDISDDDGSDSGGGAGGPSSTPIRRREGASNGVASAGRNRGNFKKARGAAAVKTAAPTARGDHGEKSGREEEKEEDEECVVVDVRDMHGDGDDDDGDDDQMVRSTQDVQMEKRMAAIRKDASSVSAQEEEKEEEEEEEEEEEGREDAEGEDEEGGEEGEGGGGEDTAAGEPSEVGTRGRVVASGRGRGGKPCPPKVLTYGALSSFLEEEGWKVTVGKGLSTWFYLIPGKKGKAGKKDVDYFVSEEEVARHVRSDNEALARYETFRRQQKGKSAKVGTRPTSGGTSASAAAKRAEGGRRGGRGGRGGRGSGRGSGRRSSSGSTEATARRGNKNAGDEISAGSAPARQDNRSGGQGSEQASGQRQGQASGRQQAERPPARPPSRARRHGGIDWTEKWRDEWPKLKEEGWHWDHGKMACVYLKKGFTKKTGTPGVSLFASRQAVLEYLFVQESAAAEPAADDAAGSSAGGAVGSGSSAGSAVGSTARGSVEEDGDGCGDAGNSTGDAAPVVEWGLAKNRARRAAADTNSTAPEVMVLPGRGAGRKFTRPPKAPTAQGGASSSRHSATAQTQDNGQSSGRGSGNGRPTPRAQDGSKRGKAQGPAPTSSVKRGRVGDDARGDRGTGLLRETGGGEDAVADNDDEADNAATQPQFELSSAINLTRLGKASPAAPAAAPAVFPESTAGEGATTRKAPEANLARASPVTSSKLSRPANGSPTTSHDSGGGGRGGGGGGSDSESGNDANAAAGPAPKRNSSSSSPPKSSSSVQGGGGTKRKGQRSPTAGSGVRSSRRRTVQGPFSDMAVVLTGLRGNARSDIVNNIQKLGGEVINILSKAASVTEWRKWLPIGAALGYVAGKDRPSAFASNDGGTPKSEVEGKPDSANTAQTRRRMIAVATPDSDRTPKFQLAMAAGMPIVHPLYVAACTSLGTEVDTAGYMLPLGRSALLGRGLIMPTPSPPPRDRPFQGKTIMLCMHGADAETPALDNWVFTLSVAGAKLEVLQRGTDDRKGAGAGAAAGAGPGLGAGVDARWCTLEDALILLQRGKVFCVIGPKRADGSEVPKSLIAVEDAAVRAGTPAGSLEWAIQCMAQGRFLLPNAGTCPWFPLGAVGGSSGSGGGGGGGGGGVVASSGRKGGKSKCRGSGRGRGGGRSDASGGGSSGGNSEPFYVRVSTGKRYVSGDFVFIEKEKGTASNKSGGAAAAAADARNPPRVARILSFQKVDGKVKATVTLMKRGKGDKALEEEGKEVVGEEVLGARVLGMTLREMEATQLYSLKDKGIYCLGD